MQQFTHINTCRCAQDRLRCATDELTRRALR